MSDSPALRLDEILVGCFSSLDAQSLVQASAVCKQWRRVSRSCCLWKPLVLSRWPSQRWLYADVDTFGMNWYAVYREFTQRAWFSPDDMQYFVQCKMFGNELHNPQLRNAMFMKMAEVESKWYQALPSERESPVHTDKNMELFFDTHLLDWTFLDRRRGYIDEVFPNKLKSKKVPRPNRHIRPYQVIPSCAIMYRWLAMFRSYASHESGLTFYRIWRFRLKHFETGLTFEISDWKAAMSSTFSNGRPEVSRFRKDALELLQLLTHQHFIMHPFGLNPRVEKSCYFAISASAGGLVRGERRNGQKRRNHKRSTNKSSTSVFLGKQMFDSCVSDIDERLEKWRARRQLALLNSSAPAQLLSPPTQSSLERQSSCGSSTNTTLMSDQDSATEECDSLMCSFSENSVFSDDDEQTEPENDSGYVTNCSHFISSSHSFDSIEDQHSRQQAVADDWATSRAPLHDARKSLVTFDVTDRAWSIAADFRSPGGQELNAEAISKLVITVTESGIPEESETANNLLNRKDLDTFVRDALDYALSSSDASGIIEAIPSSLALYRLICLFELSSAHFLSPDSASVWKAAMRHKKTGGVVHFRDFNGSFQVHVSRNENEIVDDDSQDHDGGDHPLVNPNIEVLLLPDGEAVEMPEDESEQEKFPFDEFSTAVLQLLNLIIDADFCHPYGTIAGAVA